jgi:putative sterol carrier protein
MATAIFTDAWAVAWCRELTTSIAYRQAAARWEGALVLILEADAALGIDPELAVFLDVHHGTCRSARAATAEDRETAPYVLQGNAAAWKRILAGEVEPLTALMTGKLRLTQGSLAKLLPYVQAAKELVAAARRIPSTFPPGW